MKPHNPDPGWDWFQSRLETASQSQNDGQSLANQFARCFKTPDGQACLRHLLELTQGKSFGPDIDDGVLRHMEGQRFLVSHILSLVRQGQNLPMPTP